MKRISRPRREYPYRALVCMEDALDALDWCNETKGRGRFSFAWVFHSKDLTDIIKGEFFFTNRNDHMMFTLYWVK